jgi:hypothetical protein
MLFQGKLSFAVLLNGESYRGKGRRPPKMAAGMNNRRASSAVSKISP